MIRKIWLAVLLVATFIGNVDVAHGGVGLWTSNGPEGGHIDALAIDPTTPTTLYAGSHGGGVFAIQQEVTPSVDLEISGSGPGPQLINPVTVRYSLQGCSGKEMFLVLDASAMGIPWSYLGVSGWVPLPANLATITPFSSGPPDGTYTLFTGTAPAGTYELYLGCDFVNDGVLNVDAGGNVNGVYDHLVVTVP